MKTVFKSSRVSIEENTEVEHIRDVAFYLEDVERWEQGYENTFKQFKNTTIVHFNRDCIYINVHWSKFDAFMNDFNQRKGDLIIQMKQN